MKQSFFSLLRNVLLISSPDEVETELDSLVAKRFLSVTQLKSCKRAPFD